MKVKELIEQLSKLDQESEVFISGYEGGADDLDTITPATVELRTGYCEYGYGKHNVVRGEHRKVGKMYTSGYLVG